MPGNANGFEPGPANAVTVPTCVFKLPFSLANRPAGRLIVKPLIAALPSGLVTVRLNGENAPPTGLLVPAATAGENPPKPAGQSTVNVTGGSSSWPTTTSTAHQPSSHRSWWCGQRSAGAALELQINRPDRQLRIVVDRRDQPSRHPISPNRTRQLHQHPPLLITNHQHDPKQLTRLRIRRFLRADVDAARQMLSQKRRRRINRPDPRRQPTLHGIIRPELELAIATRRQPIRLRGIDRHPFRNVTTAFFKWPSHTPSDRPARPGETRA